jgi:hypothetical protein
MRFSYSNLCNIFKRFHLYNHTHIHTNVRRHSSVGIVTSYGLDDSDSIFSTASRTALGPNHHSIHWAPRAISWIRRPGREADRSPPSSVEVKIVELYLSSPIRLHGVVLNWAQGQLYFVSYIHIQHSYTFRGIPHSLQASSGIVPQIRPPPFSSRSLPIYYSLIT